MNAATAYVEAAVMTLDLAKSETDLISWWKSEAPNRIKFRLSPLQHPGLKLKTAFDLKRKELKGTPNENL